MLTNNKVHPIVFGSAKWIHVLYFRRPDYIQQMMLRRGLLQADIWLGSTVCQVYQAGCRNRGVRGRLA